MRPAKSYTGSVRLVDRKTRVVEVLGPEPAGSKRPTDRKLFYDPGPYAPPSPNPLTMVGVCIAGNGRTAKFLVDQNRLGDSFLDYLGKLPDRPVRL